MGLDSTRALQLALEELEPAEQQRAFLQGYVRCGGRAHESFKEMLSISYNFSDETDIIPSEVANAPSVAASGTTQPPNPVRLEVCIEKYARRVQRNALSSAVLTQVDGLIADVATSIGLWKGAVNAIPCPTAVKAEAFLSSGQNPKVPRAQY